MCVPFFMVLSKLYHRSESVFSLIYKNSSMHLLGPFGEINEILKNAKSRTKT